MRIPSFTIQKRAEESIARACVITGATSGLGRATALELAKQGIDLFLVGRNQTLGERVARLCRRRNPQGRAEFLRGDLSSQRDVRELASAISAQSERLDVLINNAGARYDTYGESPEGIERTFAGNHLGHFLLTHLLLPRLANASSARVITIGSQAHAGADLGRGWVQSSGHYDRRVAYANSKLANIMFARELAARHDPTRLTSNAVDPGIVFSRFASNNGMMSWLKHVVAHALRRELVFASAGADTITYLATNDTVRHASGSYFHKRREASTSALATDLELAHELWNLSLRLTGLDR